MIRCLCCNKEILNPSEYEKETSWHKKCLKRFFGTNLLPFLDISEKELERLANFSVNKGLTVPGVQKKLSLHLETEDRIAKLTIVDYPTGYILKPQSKDFSCLPESEFMAMKMAEKARIKTVPNALLHIKGRYAYISKRIDRKDGQMRAMEDFCQLSGRMTEDKYRSSYENCGKVIKKYSKNVGLDMTEFYYRLLFSFVIGNSDMHLKNFSLIEEKAGNRVFSLSAAYDMLPVNIIMPEDKEQMALTVNGKKRNIKKKDFFILANNLGIREKVVLGLIKEILKYKMAFLEEVKRSMISAEMKEALENLIKARIAIFQ